MQRVHAFGVVITRERDMNFEPMGLIIWLIIGGVAGWLAGQLMKGSGFGLVGNIVVGIVGAFVAGLILPMLGIFIGGGILGQIINAVIGAVIALFVISLVKK
jgi:uncharacterized membrane protein YeaQ/YmgE (transglycosylase-associated protein family)